MTNNTNPSPTQAIHPIQFPIPAHQAPQGPQQRVGAAVAGFAPPSPPSPLAPPHGTGSISPAWCHPLAGTLPPAAPARTTRRHTWLLAGAAAVVVSTMASVAAIAQVGDERVAAAVSAVDQVVDEADDDALDDDAPDGPVVGDPTSSQPSEPAQPAEPTAEPSTSVPPVVLPTGTAAPAATTPPEAATEPAVVPHSLASVQAGDCLLDGALMTCHRGVDLVTHVATSDRDCFDGETTVTVTQSGATPGQVIVCVVPYALDDRTLAQAFTIDQSCGTAAAGDLLTYEIDGLVCTSASGTDYLLVKVAEGQMVTYLTDVLAAEFLGDFTADDGQVCGGHYRIDGWDVYVFGYGPFVEFRQVGDADGIRFSRSLCAA